MGSYLHLGVLYVLFGAPRPVESVWVEPCSLDQLYSMTFSMISLPLCAVDEML